MAPILKVSLLNLVMPGLVPGIHVFDPKESGGWPGQARP